MTTTIAIWFALLTGLIAGVTLTVAVYEVRDDLRHMYSTANDWVADLWWAIKLNARMYSNRVRGHIKYQRRGGLRFLKVGRLSVQWSIAKPQGGAPSRTKARKGATVRGKEWGITNGWNV